MVPDGIAAIPFLNAHRWHLVAAWPVLDLGKQLASNIDSLDFIKRDVVSRAFGRSGPSRPKRLSGIKKNLATGFKFCMFRTDF